MGIIVTDDKHYKNIASTIREKTGTEDTYAPEHMSIGVNEVYDKGKEDQDLKFWEMFTFNNKRDDYQRAFAYTDFTDYEFVNPVMIRGSAERLFYCYYGNNFPKNIDLSGVTGGSSMFAYTRGRGGAYGSPETATLYDMKLPALSSYQAAYNQARILKKIEIVRVLENTTFNSTFNGATKLEDITFDGTIGTNISFADSPLNIKSMKNIIEHLKDYKETDEEFTHSIVFSSTCLTLLEVEGNTSPNGNSWLDYIYDIGWICG